jgi:hypothetical protein
VRYAGQYDLYLNAMRYDSIWSTFERDGW